MAIFRSDGLGPETAGAASTIMLRRTSSMRAGSANVDAIDHQVNPLAHLVASQSLADDPANHLLPTAAAVKGILIDAAHLREAVVGERPLPDVIALAQRLQDFFRTAGNEPAPRLRVQGKAEAFQALCLADQEVPVLPDEVALPFSRSE
jgi:hypothetical protein